MAARALVVEDDEATREALRELIGADGFEVDAAADGERALGMLMQFDYDVVLLDIALPRLSGADVMDNLASTRPEMLEKIIVVTGLNAAEVRKLFPAIFSVVPKPVLPRRLRDLVRRCAGREHGPSDVSVA